MKYAGGLFGGFALNDIEAPLAGTFNLLLQMSSFLQVSPRATLLSKAALLCMLDPAAFCSLCI